MIVPILALAGSLAQKEANPCKRREASPSRVLLLWLMLIGTVLIVGALTFFPVLALGPIVEHFLMTGSNILY